MHGPRQPLQQRPLELKALSPRGLTQDAKGSPAEECHDSMSNDVETVLDREDLELFEVWFPAVHPY